MKRFKLYLLALVGCFVFAACGSDDPEEIIPGTGEAKEYAETYNIPAEGCDITYTLMDLKSKITTVSAATDWLEISIQDYSTGSPSIKITAKPNDNVSERRYIVTINTVNGDKLTLTLIQAGKQPDGIDDIHNNVSDQPAY